MLNLQGEKVGVSLLQNETEGLVFLFHPRPGYHLNFLNHETFYYNSCTEYPSCEKGLSK